MKRKIIVLLVCFVMALGMIPATVVSATAQAPPTVSYQTHVQDIGWQGLVTDGAISGTSGQSKRLEGIEIQVAGDSNLGISYSTHVQDIGWQGFVTNGTMSGTTGQSKRLEAIKIQLTGTDASLYDVYYCAHAQNFGWLDWAKNGASAGTTGFGYRLEAIQIVLTSKGSAGPGSTVRAFVQAPPTVSYQTHVQDIGWQGLVTDGAISGTSGQSKRLEGIEIQVAGDSNLGISYSTHVQDIGWQGFVTNGTMSGTTGQSKRLEAIKIQLTGTDASLYDVYYCAHAQNFGWLDWAKNGASAGTTGFGYRLEAIQIVLVTKGGVAPGSTTRPFYTSDTNQAAESTTGEADNDNTWILTQYSDSTGSQAMFYTLSSNGGDNLIVIDGGPSGNAEYVRSVIKALGGVVDAWILTHPHPDHIGAFNVIYEDPQSIQIQAIYDNDLDYNYYKPVAFAWDGIEVYEKYLSLTKDDNRVIHPKRDDILEIDGLKILVFNTYDDVLLNYYQGDVCNESSLVLKIDFHLDSILFTGDGYSAANSDYLMQTYGDRLKATYVQMAHHGNASLPDAFYEFVAPAVALFDAPDWLMEGENYTAKQKKIYMDSIGATVYSYNTAPNRFNLK